MVEVVRALLLDYSAQQVELSKWLATAEGLWRWLKVLDALQHPRRLLLAAWWLKLRLLLSGT